MSAQGFLTNGVAKSRAGFMAATLGGLLVAAPAAAVDLGVSASLGGGSGLGASVSVGDAAQADVSVGGGGGNLATADVDALGGAGRGGVSADACVGNCGGALGSVSADALGSGAGDGVAADLCVGRHCPQASASSGGTAGSGGSAGSGGNGGSGAEPGAARVRAAANARGEGEEGNRPVASRGEIVARQAMDVLPPVQSGPFRCARAGNTPRFDGFAVIDMTGRHVGTVHSVTLNSGGRIDTLRLEAVNGRCMAVKTDDIAVGYTALKLGFGADVLGL